MPNNKEFCPDYCITKNDSDISKCSQPTLLSSKREPEKDRCHHLDDKVLDPRPVMVKRGVDRWVEGQIVGENGDMFYVQTDGIGGIQKGSPLLRKRG